MTPGAAVAYGPADLIVACHVLYFWADPVGVGIFVVGVLKAL